MLRVAPPLVFVLTIGFNQIGIFYFNRIMRRTEFLPIVNTRGDVVGKCMASDALAHKRAYLNPVIRIAVAAHGMLYLLPKPMTCLNGKERRDILIEKHLLYGETLEQGVNRALHEALPQLISARLRYHLTYHFENEHCNRLVYLYTLLLEDDSLLRDTRFKDGKLWTFRQIAHDLGHDLFSPALEYEYEQLRTIIYTRGKYKES